MRQGELLGTVRELAQHLDRRVGGLEGKGGQAHGHGGAGSDVAVDDGQEAEGALVGLGRGFGRRPRPDAVAVDDVEYLGRRGEGFGVDYGREAKGEVGEAWFAAWRRLGGPGMRPRGRGRRLYGHGHACNKGSQGRGEKGAQLPTQRGQGQRRDGRRRRQHQMMVAGSKGQGRGDVWGTRRAGSLSSPLAVQRLGRLLFLFMRAYLGIGMLDGCMPDGWPGRRPVAAATAGSRTDGSRGPTAPRPPCHGEGTESGVCVGRARVSRHSRLRCEGGLVGGCAARAGRVAGAMLYEARQDAAAERWRHGAPRDGEMERKFALVAARVGGEEASILSLSVVRIAIIQCSHLHGTCRTRGRQAQTRPPSREPHCWQARASSRLTPGLRLDFFSRESLQRDVTARAARQPGRRARPQAQRLETPTSDGQTFPAPSASLPLPPGRAGGAAPSSTAGRRDGLPAMQRGGLPADAKRARHCRHWTGPEAATGCQLPRDMGLSRRRCHHGSS